MGWVASRRHVSRPSACTQVRPKFTGAAKTMATVDAKTSQQSLNMILAAVGMRESSQAVIQKRRKPSHMDRIPARELEQLVYFRIQALLCSPQEMAAVYTDSALLTSDLVRLIEAAQAMGQKWSKLTSERRPSGKKQC